MEIDPSIHPFIICTAYPSGLKESWIKSQLPLGERRGTPWAYRQSITSKLTFTPMSGLE